MHDPQFKILYDSQCPFCRLEVNWLKRIDRRGNLLVEDIAAPDFAPAQYDKTHEELMGNLHGLHADGRMTRGMETFRQAYRAAGIGWVVAPTGWPVLRPLFDRLYWLFARYRVRLGRMFGRSCEGDRCATGVRGRESGAAK